MTKPTKWHVRPAKIQISLGIRPVWSESSLSAWRKLGSLATHSAHSEDCDQTGSESSLGAHAILLVLSWGGSYVPMAFDLRVDPPEKCHMVYPCVMTRNHPKNTWRWHFNVTISRGFRLNHLNGSSDSVGRWENTNTAPQKDLVNLCFISIKCVWKPEPKVSKPTIKNIKATFTQSPSDYSLMICLKIIYLNTYDKFGLNLLHVYFMPSCLA